jgi:hypothetical protein
LSFNKDKFISGISTRRIAEELATVNETYSDLLLEFHRLPGHLARGRAYKICLRQYSARVMDGWAWAKARRQETESLSETPGFLLDLARKRKMDRLRMTYGLEEPAMNEPDWAPDDEAAPLPLPGSEPSADTTRDSKASEASSEGCCEESAVATGLLCYEPIRLHNDEEDHEDEWEPPGSDLWSVTGASSSSSARSRGRGGGGPRVRCSDVFYN